VVLPNRKLKFSLLKALKRQVDGNILSPEIVVSRILFKTSQESYCGSHQLLFEFYDVYLSVTEKTNQQSFELFANWAKTLLQDFNEIDRYLLDPSYVLSYLKDIEDIKKWGIEVRIKHNY
jgi:hypothetical protein